jgi:hypothetical protein
MFAAMNEFYSLSLILHGYWRWIVLATLLAAVFIALIGVVKRRPFAGAGRLSAVFAIAMLDVQFLIGRVLYGISPLVRTALGDMGAAMKTKELRFFTVEHLLMMVIAIAIAHVGFALAKRAGNDVAKYRKILIFYTISAVIMLASIPWWRPLFRAFAG